MENNKRWQGFGETLDIAGGNVKRCMQGSQQQFGSSSQLKCEMIRQPNHSVSMHTPKGMKAGT